MPSPYERAGGFVARAIRKATTVRAGLHLDRNHDYRKTLLVMGSARGGTTWLAELLNARNDFRYMFEPFHRENVEMCRDFPRRLYLRPHDDEPRFLAAARCILSGRLRNRWADQFNRRLISDRRLVKEIHLNMLLGWLEVHFPGMRTVFLLRHPCAVARSRMTQGWRGGAEGMLAQPRLVEDHLQPFLTLLDQPMEPFERHVTGWCIENLVAVRQLSQSRALVVFYEDLWTRPQAEINRLADHLGLDQTRISAGWGTLSSQTRKGSAITQGASPVTAWQEKVSSEEVERAMHIVDLFGLSRIYGRGPMPLVDAASVRGARL